MKLNRKRTIVLVLICFCVLTVFTVDYLLFKIKVKNTDVITFDIEESNITASMETFKSRKGFYPSTLENLLSDYDGAYDYYWMDPYNPNAYLKYIPITDYENNIVGYVFISGGIDGSIDNELKHIRPDSLSTIKLYDENMFTYVNYRFGNKDLLIAKAITTQNSPF